MAMNYKITQFIEDYVKVGDEYRRVEVKCDYECHNFDDLQNLILTLICNKDDIKLRIQTEEVID